MFLITLKKKNKSKMIPPLIIVPHGQPEHIFYVNILT
jgi:hypothetical protein